MVKLPTNFLCVFIVLCPSTGIRESQYNATVASFLATTVVSNPIGSPRSMAVYGIEEVPFRIYIGTDGAACSFRDKRELFKVGSDRSPDAEGRLRWTTMIGDAKDCVWCCAVCEK